MVRLFTGALLSVPALLAFQDFLSVIVEHPINGLVVAREVPDQCRESCDSVLRDITQPCTTIVCNCNDAIGAGVTACVSCVVEIDPEPSHTSHIQHFSSAFFSDCADRGFPLDNTTAAAAASAFHPDGGATGTRLQDLLALSSKLGLGRVVTTAYTMIVAAFIGAPQQAENVHSVSRLSGCGVQSPWKFDSTYHSNQTIGDRSFYVHIPVSYDPNATHAVVLSFHGFQRDDVRQEKISGFSQHGLKINNRGIIAVYPLGAWGPGKDGHSIDRAWQGAPYAKPGVNDIAFTRSIIDQLKANLCVDEKRIYAAGKSNGGGFTNLLACTPSTASLIAAFAPVSAALYPKALPIDGCNPGRVVPVINFHGTADTVIPFSGQSADKHGNTKYALPNIPQYREAWAIRDGCTPATNPNISHPYASTTVKEWQCSLDDHNAVTVEGYTVQGLGHSWPTIEGLDGDKAPFDATPGDIVPFFEAHPLN